MKNASIIAIIAAGLLAQTSGANAAFCELEAGNLVRNCGFETASTSSWTQVGDWSTGWNSVGPSANYYGTYGLLSGNYSPGYSTPQGLAGVSQTLSDVAGTRYDFSFWLKMTGSNPGTDAGGYPNQKYVVYWNGTLLLDLSSQPVTDWTEHDYTVVGTGSDIIKFEGYMNSGYNYLDNVKVVASAIQPVPEPTVLSLLGLGFAGLMGARRRKAG